MAIPLLYKTTGIILKRNNFGEGDKIISVLCEKIGKKRFIAKGIRKISSRRSSHVELFSKTAFLIHHGKTGEYVTEAKVQDLYGSRFIDLPHIAAAYCATEIIDRIIIEGNPQDDVYVLLDRFLASLSQVQADGISSYLITFIDTLLVDLGYQHRDLRSRMLGNAITSVERVVERKIKSASLLSRSGIELYPQT